MCTLCVVIECDAAAMDDAARLLRTARRITVLTGAGISTDSGIPDFRGPNGLWTKNPAAEKAASLDAYLESAEVRRFAWQNRLHSAAWTAQPNAGHLALVELERRGRLHRLVTQNVDGLHQRGGHQAERVLEVHGTMHYSRCWRCSDRRPMLDTLVRVRAGDDDPHCLVCQGSGYIGVLKSDTISFGQKLDALVIDAALAAAQDCDVLLVVGSSLQVFPVANMVPRARAHGVPILIINGESTKMDHFADVVVNGSISELLPEVVRRSKSRPDW